MGMLSRVSVGPGLAGLTPIRAPFSTPGLGTRDDGLPGSPCSLGLAALLSSIVWLTVGSTCSLPHLHCSECGDTLDYGIRLGWLPDD